MIASRMSSIASSRLSPTATQPGRSGTYAPNDFCLLDDYDVFHVSCLVVVQSSLLLPVTAMCADELPTIRFKRRDDLTHLHALESIRASARSSSARDESTPDRFVVVLRQISTLTLAFAALRATRRRMRLVSSSGRPAPPSRRPKPGRCRRS